MVEEKATKDEGETQESGHFRTSEPITMTAASTKATHPQSARGEGLRVVTMSPATGAAPAVAAPAKAPASGDDPYLGCTIDERYKVETMLGEGGMGVVYRCSHKIIGKKVAMKVLRADMARDAEVTERFLNEAKAASSIGNPHIIDISDFGQLPDGSTYFVMEFLEGVPLSLAISEAAGALPVARIIDISEQLTEGLAAAHHAQIVHRDLKPDNIYLIRRGQNADFVKILDFGIAKVSTTEGKLTRAGAVFGTPHYMSPEQAAGAPVDHRGDIYSLGVILYELASGRVPFDADNFMGILTQHMYKAPVPIRALVPEPPDVPPGLEAIILKCLSKRPEQRYESMDELGADLRRLKNGDIPEAVAEMMNRSAGFSVPQDYFKEAGAMPAPVPATPRNPSRARWPLFAGLAGIAVALLIVIGLRAGSSEPQLAAEPPKSVGAAQPTPSPEVEPGEDLAVVRQVVLAVEPLDAQVFEGNQDLGKIPVFVDIEEGKKVSVDIKREGYLTKTLELDGSEGRLSIKLEKDEPKAKTPRPIQHRAPRPKAAPRVKPKPKKKPTLGGGEIINPWG